MNRAVAVVVVAAVVILLTALMTAAITILLLYIIQLQIRAYCYIIDLSYAITPQVCIRLSHSSKF